MIYAYITLNITDPNTLAAYVAKAEAALAKHGGAPVAVSRNSTVLEGDPAQHDVAVLISFPDQESALAWRHDPELADVHALRQPSGESAVLLLG